MTVADETQLPDVGCYFYTRSGVPGVIRPRLTPCALVLLVLCLQPVSALRHVTQSRKGALMPAPACDNKAAARVFMDVGAAAVGALHALAKVCWLHPSADHLFDGSGVRC